MVQEVRILDAMANAVQNAAIVLILFSKSYQDGENTKAEAEYTRKLKKPSIFLRVEPGFAPDSWLGFMIGESRYIDFSGKYPFEEKFKELCTTIHNISRGTITMERVKPIKTKENLCVAM
nr:SJCHGC08523 protein [Schistosoma japonicum]